VAPNERTVAVEARPAPVGVDLASTAVLVVDMQNDFGAVGGMFERAGIDISGIQAVVAPIARVLAAARRVGLKVVYLKMEHAPDLSDAGAADSPHWIKHAFFSVGDTVVAPGGEESRILVKDTWNTDMLDELTPEAGDTVVSKHRYSGFFQTPLESTLKTLGVTNLVVTGCTTSICVESTVRDAMFRDFRCVVLEDCVAEPIGADLSRTNHEASLLVIERLLGWVSDSERFLAALGEPVGSARELASSAR
jgi:ureidoacrylate peracid hydrolase